MEFNIDIHLTFNFFIAFHNFFLLLLTVPPGAGVRSGARRSGPAGGTSAASSAAQSSTISAHRFAANSSPAAFTGEDVYYTLCTGSLVNSLMDSSVPDP